MRLWWLVWAAVWGGVAGSECVDPQGEDLCAKMFPGRESSPLDVQRLDSVGDCELSIVMRDTYTVGGANCISVPTAEQVIGKAGSRPLLTQLALLDTGIKRLEPGALSSWSHLTTLRISLNSDLTEIVPGAFQNLSRLTVLSISDSVYLGNFHTKSFEGLLGLEILELQRNNFFMMDDVTQALSAKILPSLRLLDFSGNNIPHISKKDFQPMEGSGLDELRIMVTNTEFIHKDAFAVLKNLSVLDLSINNLNTSVLSEVTKTLTRVSPRFNQLIMKANLLHLNSRVLYDVVAKSNISTLKLSNSHFGIVKISYFPLMPYLKHLDMSSSMLNNILGYTLDSQFFPALEILDLSGNQFSSVPITLNIKSLKKLIISDNSNNLPWDTSFTVPVQIFKKMPNIEYLDLSGNRLDQVKNETFKEANSLKYLMLQRANIIKVEDFSFQNNSKLIYLDLSRNVFPRVSPFVKEIFFGLENLKMLDLSYCHISIIINPDVFSEMKNLKYLSLKENKLLELNGVFFHTKRLVKVDLGYNIITSWYREQFMRHRNLTIQLDHNQITTITTTMLEEFQGQSNVTLDENPLICNCELIHSVQKVLGSSPMDSLSSINASENLCLHKHNQSVFKYVSSDIYTITCLSVNPLMVFMCVILGLIVLLVPGMACFYRYQWEFKYYYYVLRERWRQTTLPWRKRKSSCCEEYRYDAFVSYSHRDKWFVSRLIAFLHNEHKFRLCVDTMEFMAGELIMHAVMDRMSKSRMSLLVLSEAFFKSQWCQWEMQIAEKATSFKKTHTLVIIKLGNIDDSLMTPNLKFLMKTRIYLQWDPHPFKQKLFWSQLINAIQQD